MGTYLRHCVVFCIFVALFIVFPVGSRAQTSRVAAGLEGTVTDSSGAAVAGAGITLRNLDTGLVRKSQSNAQGGYHISELPVGVYELRAEYPGFAPYVRTGLTLAVGQLLHLEVKMSPASVTQQVTVNEAPPLLETTQPTQTTLIDSERIEELPVHSRNYLNFVLLAPGVAASPGRQAAGAQSQLPTSGFSFGGLRPRSNNLSIDGLNNNDEYSGASRTELSLETVREFQVVNNGLSAEFGGASGGGINVVTKSGANIHHGDAFLFLQNGTLDSRPAFLDVPGKPDVNRYRAGFAIGGLIRRDRTFFYTGFEQEHNRAQAASDVDPQAAAAINSFFASGGYPGLSTRRVTTGFFPVARAETEASGKLDHQLSQRHSLMLRYSFTNNREAGDAFNTGGFTDASARGSSFIADHGLVGSLASVFSGDAVNDLRFQLATRRVLLRTVDTAGPDIEIPGVLSFGRPYEGNNKRRENHYEASDTVSVVRGRHLLKAGGIVNRIRERGVVPDGFGGLFLFRNLDDFFSGFAVSYRQAFGNPRTDFAVTGFGGFLQDHWTMTRKLTLDLGLRYDLERLSAQFNQDINNFSPRIGIAYGPGDKWVVRAGYGIFFDRYPLAELSRVLQKNGVQASEFVTDWFVSGGIFNVKANQIPITIPLPPPPPSIYTADPHLPASYSQQANLGVEHLIGANWTAGANYLFTRGVKLSRTVNANLPPPTLCASGIPEFPSDPQQIGRLNFCGNHPDPRFTDIYQLQHAASSSYHGLSLSLNRHMANEIEFSANYTVSKTIDDASDFDEQPENPYNLRAERSLSRSDQRQRFVFSGLFDLPFGDEEDRRPGVESGLASRILGNIELAPILTVGSGVPVNPLTGQDSSFSHPFPLSARPFISASTSSPQTMARNSLRMPTTATLDLRTLKYFKVGEHGKLDLVVEFFNLLNRTNVGEISPFYGPGARALASFARPIDALSSRQMQFSIDFEF